MAIRAIRAIGLDVGGVDFLTPDITQSYKDVGGGICEVNAAPGFRMHVAPSEGTPRDVAGPVMDMLFPPGSQARIPICAITGTNGKTTTSRMVGAHPEAGRPPGRPGHHRRRLHRRRPHGEGRHDRAGRGADDPARPDGRRRGARDRARRPGAPRHGLPRCATSARCINVSGDHLGLGGIDTLEQLAEVKRIVVEVATDTAVLNADDELCLKMADYTEAKHLCYVTMNPRHPLVREHIRAGARAVVLEEGLNGQQIVLYDTGRHIPLLWTHLIPATMEGRAMHNVQNAMFAAAVAYSLGKKLEDIRHGLRTFDTSFFQAPGRMNVFDEHPFKVILDYGHNPAAVRAMCQLVERTPVRGRRIVRAHHAGRPPRRGHRRGGGDRGRAMFDHYILKRDDNPRGREPDEVPKLLEAGLLAHGVAPDADHASSRTSRRRCRRRWSWPQPNDLVLVFGDNITRCWKQIIYFGRDPAAGGRRQPAPPAEPAHRRTTCRRSGDLGQLPDGAAADPRRARRAARPRARGSRLGAAMSDGDAPVVWRDSRRLTGPSLLLDGPGRRARGEPGRRAARTSWSARWRTQAGAMLAAVGWPDARHRGAPLPGRGQPRRRGAAGRALRRDPDRRVGLRGGRRGAGGGAAAAGRRGGAIRARDRGRARTRRCWPWRRRRRGAASPSSHGDGKVSVGLGARRAGLARARAARARGGRLGSACATCR